MRVILAKQNVITAIDIPVPNYKQYGECLSHEPSTSNQEKVRLPLVELGRFSVPTSLRHWMEENAIL